MKKSGINPFLPSWEYIPDGEPKVFEGRVYLYGSHDRFNGYTYCLNDYVCWSAPVNDLTDWRYEGVIYKKTDDPYNKEGNNNLYAPDVTQGADGRYYLYYVLDKMEIIGVAVCDTPCGRFEFFGFVRYENNIMLGRKEGDVPQFDPAVITIGKDTYLYSGQCSGRVKSVDDTRTHSIAVLLAADMLTIKEGPFNIIPGLAAGKGTGFEGHEFFEGSSIRFFNDTFYFVYSSFNMNELCYATSKNPLGGFEYGGVIVSNADIGIDTYKPAAKKMYHGNNNHGSIVQIAQNFYVFYHRHTNGNEYSRQACLEPVKIKEDGSIDQVEMTSSAGGILPGIGEYPAYIACNIFCADGDTEEPTKEYWPNRTPALPFITQDDRDMDAANENNTDSSFIANITDGFGFGFKYFDLKNISAVKIKTRGFGFKGHFEVKTSWDGEILGLINTEPTNKWKEFSSSVKIPDGKQSLYFIYKGKGNVMFKSFTLEQAEH
ncbi:MAG: family 43 glycosylhydrolase [Treponema sp.]|nr:family 43 glycosylhydrolase [Treponema sp.]MCL2236647.1 family 43 glycosylhydrolase [Treponema sp.]